MAPRIKCLCNSALWLLICGAFALSFSQRNLSVSGPVYFLGQARFSHATEQHRAACNSCHTFPSKNWRQARSSDEAFADITQYPEHQACLGCHRQQFFARERPAPAICSNCHVKATPVETTLYPFPSLGEAFLLTAKGRAFVSDFRVLFPHEKHADASCEDCHRTHQPQGNSDDEFVTSPPKNLGDEFWLKKGTFKTQPLTHAQCFICHNTESELPPVPSNCDACHTLSASEKHLTDFDEKLAGLMGIQDWWTLSAWRARTAAGAFRHEIHADLECGQCHSIGTPEVVPVKSCGGAEGCHITATSDEGGILNYEIDQRQKSGSFVCTKCHLTSGAKPLPARHVNAIPKAAH